MPVIDLETRKWIVKMIAASGGKGHVGGSMSCVEILVTLYFHQLRVKPEDPCWPERDRMLLSKGHAGPALYCVLALRGYFPTTELYTLDKPGTRLSKHVDCVKLPAADISAGMLGQGLSIGVGMAIEAKHSGNPGRIYVVLGDGEMQSGQVWEAGMTAAKYHLDNLTAIVDRNQLQVDGLTEQIMPLEPLAEKWAAFGWNVLEVDGHDVRQLLGAYDAALACKGRPTMIIATTVKGKGISLAEGNVDWHHHGFTVDQARKSLIELGEEPGEALEQAVVVSKLPAGAATIRPGRANLFTDSVGRTYAEALLELLGEGEPLMFVEADVMGTWSKGEVLEGYPDRLIQVGVAEQNAVGVAAGLAHMGKIPFVNTLAILMNRRAADQVWMSVAFSNANVKLVGTYSGFTAGPNGPTHQSLEDIAVFRSFPNMVILEPADCSELRQAVRAAVRYRGPVYIRNVRGEMLTICDPGQPPFEIGKAAMLRPGNDATIIAGGIMVQFALEARDILAQQGVEARVVNARTIKPLDEEMVLRCGRETGAIVTVEDHSVIGGLGGAVSEFLSEALPTPIRRIGVRDEFGAPGEFGWLIETYHMDTPDIVAAVKAVVRMKASGWAFARA
jgi:transketolase